MLFTNNNLVEKKFNSFYRYNDLEIGVIGYTNKEITVTSIDHLYDFVREIDGDYIIVAKQGSDVVLITHPLLTKTCYYHLNDLEISLMPVNGQERNWTPCLANTFFRFQKGKLISMIACVIWDCRELYHGYDKVFEEFENVMHGIPKNNTTLSSGKDTGVICAYLHDKKIKSVYHTVMHDKEHPQVFKQRIGLIKAGNKESRLVITTNQAIDDNIKTRTMVYNSICWPRVQTDLQSMADLDVVFSGVRDHYILLGNGGDQLYRFKSDVTSPNSLYIDEMTMISEWNNVTHLNPLMGTQLYQNYLNVQQSYKKTHCWQEKYMADLNYPYSVDKYRKSS